MLGTAIRQARDQAGISQEKLAELVGVSRQAVSKWELGQTVPTISNLSRIEAVLQLPAGALTEQMEPQAPELSAAPKRPAKMRRLLGCAALCLLPAAFFLGRFIGSPVRRGPVEAAVSAYTTQGPADGRSTVFPMDENGTIRLDLPLSAPGEEDRLITQLEFYQWPESLDLEMREMVDFDQNPPWGPADENLSAGWELRSELPMIGTDGAVLGLARSVEEYDGPTLWLLARSSQDEPWTVLERMNEDALCWKTAPDETQAWAVPVGTVLGYQSLLVEYGGSAVLLAAVNGAPRIIFHLTEPLEGFADLDLDGELEIVCRQVEGPFQIYDRTADGYLCYTLSEAINDLEVPDEAAFCFDPANRAFGFESYYDNGASFFMKYAPVYDRISQGYLWRRDGVRDTRFQGGLLDGTAATFQDNRPDEVTGWTLDGAPILTTRQKGAVMLRELESLTGYRPERCYICGSNGLLSVSLLQNSEQRTFFDLTFADPSYYENGCLVDNSMVIGHLILNWKDEWSSWSPLDKEAVPLPADWESRTAEDRGLWWYERSIYFDHGPIVSVEPAQYEDVMKFNLENGGFLEVKLDQDGFLTSIYGPYTNGPYH